MEFKVKNELSKEEYEKTVNFLDSLPFYCIEQHPDWNVKIEAYSHSFFLCTDENNNILGFANIILSNGPFKTAQINFGPAFRDFEVLESAIKFLHNYFSTNKFIFFSVQLGIQISNQTELLEYNINRDYKVKYHFKPGNLWASVCVDLVTSENEILNSFSKGHKSSIKSVYSKSKLRVSRENNPEHLKSFLNLYIKMMEVRKLDFNKADTLHLFDSINDFIYENNNGFIEYILEGDSLVGGVIIIFQGRSVRYFKGAGDPERRDIPILHFGLFEAMKFCKQKGFISFDLWGYNHFVDEKDQIFYINRFKKGFSKDFIFFPKRMHFILKPLVFKIYTLLKNCKKAIVKFKNKNLPQLLFHY